ncbi:hypothetical protein OJ996_02920 [Luteolibacter sp. GHJ8]|uniref:Uncharacterized protein n=1 Tax=Luteolibacter rhizosphaerae TaxID=2989719 RepID=A0ABT3FZ47_9BACT|nr:hypothetical protein [Luteolibacter rhizosphaerae]MCW1912509.1 hypothetical protein [Luteolibacter rhizosphaerae]
MDHFRHDFSRRMLYPRTKVVSSETILAFSLHHLGVPQEQKLERASDGAGMHRLPKPVEDEDWMVKMPYHTFSQ